MNRLVLVDWYYVQFLDTSGRDPDPRDYLWGRVIEHPCKPSLEGSILRIELAYGCAPPAPCKTLNHQPVTLKGEGSEVRLDMAYRPLFLQGQSPFLLSTIAEYFIHTSTLAATREHAHDDRESTDRRRH